MMCHDRDARRFFPPQARYLVAHIACQEGREQDFSGFLHDSIRARARLVAGRGDITRMNPATAQRIMAEMVLKPHRVCD